MIAFSYNFSGNKYCSDIEKLLFDKYIPSASLTEESKFKLEEVYIITL